MKLIIEVEKDYYEILKYKPNCVTCDHFGKCEGCERSGEE